MSNSQIFFISAVMILGSLSNGTLHAGLPKTAVDRAELDIRLNQPGVSRETLAADRVTLESTFQTLKGRLKRKGFTDEEITQAVVAAWITERRVSTSKLVQQAVLSDVGKTGYLIVESEPGEAAVIVDGENWGNTRSTRWIPSGKHHITLQKAGYYSEEADQDVPAEQRTTFKRDLRKK
jgi:hypothetical protein